MAFLQSLPSDEIPRYHRVACASLTIRSHFDLMVWLQGDMQDYLPHDIMITAWGNFQSQEIQFDIISSMVGVRSHIDNSETIKPLLTQLFARWEGFGHTPFSLSAGADGFTVDGDQLNCAVTGALQGMRSAIVHGIKDRRGNHDCLYVAFSVNSTCTNNQRLAMAMVLPYIDAALRQVEHLPHQKQAFKPNPVEQVLLHDYGLSEREAEVMHWVAAGKTNPEIGLILDISGFTIKNHLQRVFKKLDVLNRAQAVSRINTLSKRV